jgi:hypothetical protein
METNIYILNYGAISDSPAKGKLKYAGGKL